MDYWVRWFQRRPFNSHSHCHCNYCNPVKNYWRTIKIATILQIVLTQTWAALLFLLFFVYDNAKLGSQSITKNENQYPLSIFVPNVV